MPAEDNIQQAFVAKSGSDMEASMTNHSEGSTFGAKRLGVESLLSFTT